MQDQAVVSHVLTVQCNLLSSNQRQIKTTAWNNLLHQCKSFRCGFHLILQRNCQTWESRWRHWKRKMWHTWKKPWIYKRYARKAWLNVQMNSVESFFNGYTAEEPSVHFRKVLLGRGLTGYSSAGLQPFYVVF